MPALMLLLDECRATNGLLPLQGERIRTVDQPKAHDYLFDNAPLVEVVAELRWKLQPVTGFQDGPSIDPHFGVFSSEFETAARAAGFASVEQLVPDVVPLAVLAHKVTKRFRIAPGGYPLFQIGPGVMSVNMVPPYKGWAEFSKVLKQGLALLWSTYPMPDKYLSLRQIELRYIDAFTRSHGVEQRNDFLVRDIGVAAPLPARILATGANVPDAVQQSSQAVISLKKPVDSIGILQVEHGTSGDADAVLATFVVRKSGSDLDASPENIAAWFDEAHAIAREWFDALLTDKVRARLGRTTPI